MTTFSQTTLQDYVDCPRRYQLKHIERLAWPAVIAEPAREFERHMQRGADFHHMIHQHHLGIPASAISGRIVDDDLRRWWAAYLASPYALDARPGQRHPETLLTMTLGGHRLLAKYDLLIITPDRLTIIDWKTSERPPRRETLAGRLQTRVYPFVAVSAGAGLTGAPIQPENVEMVYWFAERPDTPITFDYSAAQYERDRDDLTRLIAMIESEQKFDLTTDTKQCQFCAYRSLCERGVRAGDMDALDDVAGADDDLDLLEIDLDQVAEIEF